MCGFIAHQEIRVRLTIWHEVVSFICNEAHVIHLDHISPSRVFHAWNKWKRSPADGSFSSLQRVFRFLQDGKETAEMDAMRE